MLETGATSKQRAIIYLTIIYVIVCTILGVADSLSLAGVSEKSGIVWNTPARLE